MFATCLAHCRNIPFPGSARCCDSVSFLHNSFEFVSPGTTTYTPMLLRQSSDTYEDTRTQWKIERNESSDHSKEPDLAKVRMNSEDSGIASTACPSTPVAWNLSRTLCSRQETEDAESGKETNSLRHPDVHSQVRGDSSRTSPCSRCESDGYCSADSALGPSLVSPEDVSDDEGVEQDTSLLGTEQCRSMQHKSTHGGLDKSRAKSLSEELAEADQGSEGITHQEAQGPGPRSVEQDSQAKLEDSAMKHETDRQETKTYSAAQVGQSTSACEIKRLKELHEYREQLEQQGRDIAHELQVRRDFLHQLVERWFVKMTIQVQTTVQDESSYVDSLIRDLETQAKDLDVSDLATPDHRTEIRSHQIQTNERMIADNLNKHQLGSGNRGNPEMLPHELKRKLILILGTGCNITTDMLGSLSWSFFAAKFRSNSGIIAPGRFVRQFDSRRGLPNRHTCNIASGLSLTTDGKMVITDLGTDSVRVCDARGNTELQVNVFPYQDPTNAVQLCDGRFAVVCRNSVKIFNAQGEYLRELDGDLNCPQDIALNRNGDLVVTDMTERQHCVYIYARADHRLLHTIVGGRHAPLFTNAWRVSVNHQDDIIISDNKEHCVKILTPRGILVGQFGQRGAAIGQLFHPAGTCTDQYGHILVADSANNRVQMFSPHGDFLAILVCDDDLATPIDVAVNEKEGELLVLQGDGEVRVYRYLR